MLASDVLSVWELGQDQDTLGRTLAVLVGGLRLPRAEAESLSLGERDARILGLHERIFGPRLAAMDACPRCAERVTFEVAVDSIRAAAGPAADGTIELHGFARPTWTLRSGAAVIGFRVPDSAELRAASTCASVAEARRLLLERCVVEPTDVAELGEDVEDQLSERIGECDPQAEVRLEIRCPECGHQWLALLEVAAFFWAELSAYARRLLHQVGSLARAYHWSEA